jgi:hypothetical protein
VFSSAKRWQENSGAYAWESLVLSLWALFSIDDLNETQTRLGEREEIPEEDAKKRSCLERN